MSPDPDRDTPPGTPDLTAELDEAEAIVTGRAEAIVTEWGMRHDDCLTDVHDYGRDKEAACQSVADHARLNGRLVRRTVTYWPVGGRVR